MADSTRLTNLLLDILDRIKHRGASTKVLWTNFSNGSPVPRSRFDQLVGVYGLHFQPGDLDIIWANLGIKGDTMGYSDFVRFITLEKINPSLGRIHDPLPIPSIPIRTSVEPSDYETDFTPSPRRSPSPRRNPPRRRAQTLSDILTNHRRQIGNDLLELDPSFTGFVSVFDFELIIQRIDSIDSAEIQRFLSSYDTRNTGSFNYFTLLSDLCNESIEDDPIPNIRKGAEPPLRQYNPDPPGRQYNMDPPARQSYAEPDFVDDFPVVPQRSPRKESSRSNEIIRTISSRMTEVFESSAACFNKWRGYGRTVGPQEFVTGAKRDFNIDLTMAEAQEIIDKFSGPWTLGTFLKMIGAGADAASAQARSVRSAQLDENEKTLQHIARQGRGKDWEGVFENGQTVEQIVMGLKKLAIYVLGNDLRPCISKYGKDGVVGRIREFMDAL
jgi:hypothetical protein